MAQLTAQRTAALREALTRSPDVAFIAVVHALVASTFYFGNRVSSLDMSARPVHLSGHAARIDQMKARSGGRAATGRPSWRRPCPPMCKTSGKHC